MIVPFILPTKVWKGKFNSTTTKISIPGQPKRVIRTAMIPAKARGVMREATNVEDFVSIVLKSLESRFIILPSSWDFAVYWEIFDNFE